MVLSLSTVSMKLIRAAFDREDELAQERLMVVLAQRLVALREVVAFLHLEAFERLDQLRRCRRGPRTSTFSMPILSAFIAS